MGDFSRVIVQLVANSRATFQRVEGTDTVLAIIPEGGRNPMLRRAIRQARELEASGDDPTDDGSRTTARTARKKGPKTHANPYTMFGFLEEIRQIYIFLSYNIRRQKVMEAPIFAFWRASGRKGGKWRWCFGSSSQ